MSRLRHRAEHAGLHGSSKINKQRRAALIMIATGLMRVAVWLSLLLAYVLKIPFAHHLFTEVSFVTILSVLALALTDWGQVASSLAQLTAGDAHRDAEHTRTIVEADLGQIESDIARLAQLQPGPDAQALVNEIKVKLGADSDRAG